MKTIPSEFGAGSLVWVWDSTWLPAKIVRVDKMDRFLVKLDHGVTFTVTNEDVRVREFDGRGNDLPPRFFKSSLLPPERLGNIIGRNVPAVVRSQ